jgi:hypothetical protein
VVLAEHLALYGERALVAVDGVVAEVARIEGARPVAQGLRELGMVGSEGRALDRIGLLVELDRLQQPSL